ncbi:DeoR family transcriptional regulator [Bombiscardovia nodaiensis]|uniref:DeoR family transcriptional regulator n=1 Tax=Bombiscardovia nodaiensis TaxID=2932181 RepID=A0ABM8B8M2_9BIFI|nr:DeoR family transcriptional regulator [Bombiscardovia nodaiensis]
MLLDERRQQILDKLAQHGQSVRELSDGLGVSEGTIRRDLTYLERQGQLERKYGGAMLTQGSRANMTDSGSVEVSADGKKAQMSDLDRRVAAAAAGLVQDGSTIILDVGPLTALIAHELKGRQVTIITANLAVLDQVRHDDTVDVVLVGGALRHHHDSLVGFITEQTIEQIAADTMFLTCTGVRGDTVVDNMAIEAPIKQRFIAAAEQVVLLADETKFPGNGSLKLCTLDQVNTLVTTGEPTPDVLKHFQESDRRLIQA